MAYLGSQWGRIVATERTFGSSVSSCAGWLAAMLASGKAMGFPTSQTTAARVKTREVPRIIRGKMRFTGIALSIPLESFGGLGLPNGLQPSPFQVRQPSRRLSAGCFPGDSPQREGYG